MKAACMAHDAFRAAYEQFNNACTRHDFKAAELARVVVLGSIEAAMDHIAASHLRIREARHGS